MNAPFFFNRDRKMMENSRLGERTTFLNCLRRLLKINHSSDASSKTDINVLIDELIALDYSQKFVDEKVHVPEFPLAPDKI